CMRYPSDTEEAERAFAAPYPVLIDENALRREARPPTGMDKHTEAAIGSVLSRRHSVVARSDPWAPCLRRLTKEHAQLPRTAEGLQIVAFALGARPQALRPR